MIYFDTSYLVRLYLAESGCEAVRALAATEPVAASVIGRTETLAAFHRKRREGALTAAEYRIVREEFARDCAASAFRWLSVSNAVLDRTDRVFARLGADVYLRGADAIHLATAAESGLTEIYSNDRHLLAAARHFGLRGRSVF